MHGNIKKNLLFACDYQASFYSSFATSQKRICCVCRWWAFIFFFLFYFIQFLAKSKQMPNQDFNNIIPKCSCVAAIHRRQWNNPLGDIQAMQIEFRERNERAKKSFFYSNSTVVIVICSPFLFFGLHSIDIQFIRAHKSSFTLFDFTFCLIFIPISTGRTRFTFLCSVPLWFTLQTMQNLWVEF